MNKEESLSEKREELFFNGEIRECFKEGTILKKKIEEQDKEFIRLLKEQMCNPKEFQCVCCNTMELVLEKLAGDKLTGAKKNEK